MEKEKVLVVEDEFMFREFLVNWLTKEGYEVVGEAGDLAGALARSAEVEVDIVLLDMDLPDGEGMEYVVRQLERRPTTRILVLTAYVEKYAVVKLKRSGVMGVLDKGDTGGEELKQAFAAIGAWRTYYSDRIERSFRDIVREATAFYKTLSPREEEMLKYFGRGMSNELIAENLGLSVATIQGHRRNVMAKIGVRCTRDLMIWTLQNGFVRAPEICRMNPVEGRVS